MSDRNVTPAILAAATVALLAIGPFIPAWQFLIILSLAKGLVVLGLTLLLRTGLVSFGQGLYYCIGAYAAGGLGQFFGITGVFAMLVAGTATAALVAFVLGFLLSNYRSIFFAMLSLAFSMILFGLLVKTSALGSTDGFNIVAPQFFGYPISGKDSQYALYALTAIVAFLATLGLYLYSRTPLGRLAPAIRDNEIRVEYLGASVRSAIHVNYVIAGALAGLGGTITGIAVGHIDPEMAYWTTSGEFVFVAILSGSGNVLAPFLGSLVFEIIRTFAYEYSPNTWQMVLGIAMLLVIVFLPAGLWSIFTRRARA